MQCVRGDGEEGAGVIHLPGVWISGGGEDQYRKECEEPGAGGWSAEPEGEVFCRVEAEEWGA